MAEMTYKTRYALLMDRAQDIARQAHMSSPRTDLPRLYLFTDPVRIPHPENIAAHLPQGTAIVYRHFGEANAHDRAQTLQAIAQQRGLYLLIGNDAALAQTVGATGVHLSQAHIDQAPKLRTTQPDLWLTAACHDIETLKHPALNRLDAIFASPVFASQSPSAIGKPALGMQGIARICALSPVPVMGLGGITHDNAHQLIPSGLSGFGAIEAFSL